MIFRAAFFIGLVAILTPYEPHLGAGRLSSVISLPFPAFILSLASLSRTGQVCSFCAGRPASWAQLFTASYEATSFRARGLSDIKAEIDAAIRAR